jgi:hypothetical protein
LASTGKHQTPERIMSEIATVTGADIPDRIWQDPQKRQEFIADLHAAFPGAKRTLRGNCNVYGDDAKARVAAWLSAWLADHT